jgi:hypothetical protein
MIGPPSEPSIAPGLPDEQAATWLRALAEQCAWVTGPDYFRALVRGLANALDAPWAIVSAVHDDGHVRPLACWHRGAFEDSAPEGDWTEGRLEVPMVDASATVVGHVAVGDRKGRRWTSVEAEVLKHVARRAAREIEHESVQARGPRLARLAHDLRTPLNGILGYASLLARDATLGPRQQGSVDKIRQCGLRLLDLVGTLDDSAAPVGAPSGPTAARTDAAITPAPLDDGPLPEGLRQRLVEEARRGDVNALGRSVDELALSGRHPRLVAELRAHAQVFDLKAIRGRLDQMAPGGATKR